MQTTPNFGFNIVEGADIVNPLTQLNPNFTSLDTIFKYATNRLFNRATCTKTGTVFAVVKDNTTFGGASGADVMKFTAPADWNTGDTMTLDGTSVTVQLVDGSAPTTGCIASGSEVIILQKGTTVTVLASAKYIPAASEVTTSGGDSVQDYIDNTKYKNLETWTPNIGENWQTFLARIRDNSTKTIPANFIRCTVDGISGLIFRQSRRTSATSWQYETDYFTGNSLVKYAMSVGSDTAVLRKYDLLNGTVTNLSTEDAQIINIYGLDV